MDSDSSYVGESEDSISSPDPQLPASPPPPRQRIPSRRNPHQSPSSASISQRIIPSLADNPFAQGEDAETYFTRPNRYFGPASTWRSWTERERTAALSIDRLRSQDLSLHLFNAVGLKRKAQESSDGRKLKQSKKAKGRASSVLSTATGDDEERGSRGRPTTSTLPKSWTAWPMPPDQVPREELLPRIGESGEFRTMVDTRPSSNLEECLVATATRLARERWDARPWEDPGSEMGMRSGTKTDPEEIDGASQTPESADESQEEEEVASMSGDDDLPMFSSQTFSTSDEADDQPATEVEEESDNESSEVDRRPVPLADEENARQYLIPSARHILTKLDDLLLGLHKARHAYAAKPPGKQRGRYFQTAQGSEGEARSRSQSRARKRKRSSSTNSVASSASATSTTSGKRSRRVGKLGLRDWSDVMGMASLTGWNPAVVERASERCARLFGENMLFRTFHPGDAKEGKASYFTEHLALESEGSVEPDDGDQEGDVRALRTSVPCENCRGRRMNCQPADMHGGNFRPCKNCLDMEIACSGISVKVCTAHGRFCPHQSCPRHMFPFRKQHHLQRHLANVHRSASEDTKFRGRRRSMPSSARASVDVSDVDVWPGAGSAPVITCPVRTCPRGKQPFAAGKYLYDHVRRMHPEVDVQELKRLESKRRSERRGRWKDERRHRSVSRKSSRRKQTDGEADDDEEEENHEL
ncbi:uncharacterized protein Z518_10574 [Rhinocladiella mackenziei CBS 650.93]|uniref:Zn(2)-C6 fungal-type domain-containing protein n=1 Tax=Rhinocladiella mackenziei CBS 650.93 TaxID=1442369 RepID=A0A0D2IUP1_9EURO|nr:uncharacterized protein Z518_10574 [Rhinocladiella mackenziei CBS 650.93]KIX00435.1 hypothetical protein Z518_10574 [Rhinocladiella mackenziei CBS 650.93]